MTRRLALFLALAFTVTPAFAQPLFTQRPGIVSYTFREDFKKDVPSTLDAIKAMGITDIEFSDLFGLTAAGMRQLLDERGMTCSSFGTSYENALNKTDEVAADARTLGAQFVRVAWIPHKGPFTLELTQKVADDFNLIGKALKEKHGLTFCYHNHGYEFVPHNAGTLFDELVRLTDPLFVSFELDILWAHFPGIDPAALIVAHGERIRLLHLKDLRKGIKGDLSGKTPVENDVALGTGQIDIPAVLNAAQQVRVAHYYIEDESPQPQVQVPQSIEYLRNLTR